MTKRRVFASLAFPHVIHPESPYYPYRWTKLPQYKRNPSQAQRLTLAQTMPPVHLLFIFLLILPPNALSLRPELDWPPPSALPKFREAPAFRNGGECAGMPIHIVMTLDYTYLRGSVAAVFSILQHAACPENFVFHFITTSASSSSDLRGTIASTFPYLSFHVYYFDAAMVRNKISSSVRRALDQPLNYARIYLADLLPTSVLRIIYLDSDLVVVDDIAKLWSIDLRSRVLGAPEYCQANFTCYFTPRFWSSPFASLFRGKRPCYFNTGVMVIDLAKWREGKFTERLEYWMSIQKMYRIYELGSLPPFLLVFGGDVEGVEHRWNQHGLGGDNVEGLCRDLHQGPVSLLHWSGKGKPWLRIDAKRPCPMDSLWTPYDLGLRSSLFSDS